eukprot:UN34296
MNNQNNNNKDDNKPIKPKKRKKKFGARNDMMSPKEKKDPTTVNKFPKLKKTGIKLNKFNNDGSSYQKTSLPSPRSKLKKVKITPKKETEKNDNALKITPRRLKKTSFFEKLNKNVKETQGGKKRTSQIKPDNDQTRNSASSAAPPPRPTGRTTSKSGKPKGPPPRKNKKAPPPPDFVESFS